MPSLNLFARITTSIFVLNVFAISNAHADLHTYVEKPEPKFTWSIKDGTSTPLGQVHSLTLVSQEWQGLTWEHSLQLFIPRGVSPTRTMFLWNQGGKPDANSAAFGLALATKIQAPVAFLYGIPNQPLFDGLREDALIAETFVRCLDTGNDEWPLLFPMVKSLVKAMDALQAFSEKELKTKVEGFVVSGASKRGWTTWLTAACDKRVKAIAPLVIDTLNLPKQLPHQLECFGGYSEMIGDYTRRNLVPLPDTSAARKLWQMVDPYSYRDRVTVPKLILNGANDRYWTLDALNLYWDGLQGDKWVAYVPNAGHSLTQQHADGKRDRNRAIDTLTAFGRCQIHGKEMPKLIWAHDDVDGRCFVRATSTVKPTASRLWVVDSPNRDFRSATWVEKPAEMTPAGTVTASVEPPATGFRAFYLEMDFNEGGSLHLSTQIRVTGR